ncbi:MAG: metallophosphoesterase family protein [Clostridia bacterium]|jgi:protein phosphatase|nr:metallophosphoesterase family protein [Clostridia bacterium]
MRIAIISDIHGNLEALKSTIKDIKTKQIDKIYCLGDIISKGNHTHECIEIIRKECEIVLRGNCDRHFSGVLDKEKVKERLKEKAQIEIDRWDNLNEILTEEEKQYLNKLPYSHEFYLSGSLVRMFHASPERDNLVVINQDFLETKYKMFLPSEKTLSQKVADIVVYGHIHHQYMDKMYNKTLLNTGSVGNSFCLIRNDKKDSNVKEIRQAHYVILEGKYGEKEYSASTVGIEFVKVPYNVEKELEDDAYEKDIFRYEVLNGTYRNMTKIKENFERLGINFDEF